MKETQLYYYNDNKSQKFWEITYDSEKGGEYKTRFGKNGSEGRQHTKIDTLENIEKLIQTKIKKGYIMDSNQPLQITPEKLTKNIGNKCEENIEKNVLNKFEKGKLYIKNHKVTEKKQAGELIKSMKTQYCHPVKNSKKTTKKCTMRNPEPPCKEGYEENLTKKGENCCYKSTKKSQKPILTVKSKKENKCTMRNPEPPCKEGYEEKLTNKGENCCYKNTKKKYVSLSKFQKEELIKLFEIYWEDNEFPFLDLPSGILLTISDLNNIIKNGDAINVLEPQQYNSISTLDLKHFMFELLGQDDEVDKFGYFRDDGGGIAVSGSGDDVWLKANEKLYNFLKKYQLKERKGSLSNVKNKEKIYYLLEFKEGNSNKFYEIQINNNDNKIVDITWGKIGSQGRHDSISFISEKKAIEYIEKIVEQKKKKGYYIKGDIQFITENKTSSSSKKTQKLKSPQIVFTKTPMLADKFYDPNVDMEFKETGEYNKKKWIVFNGDSGERKGEKWVFTHNPTLYAVDPINWFISEKYDGVRAVWNGQNFTSRSQNIYHAPEWFKELLPSNHSLDGELHCGRGCFQKASGITRHLEPIDKDWVTIKFQVFDIPDPELVNKPFTERITKYKEIVKECCQKWKSIKLPSGIKKPKECPIEFAEQIRVNGIEEAYQIYKEFITRGAEGAMLRPSDSIYEHKRSKLLLKWKPCLDAEAVVINYNEGSGRLKSRLGTFQVQLIDDNTKKVDPTKEFSLSGRLTDEFRNQYKFKDGKIISVPKKNDKYPIIGDKVTLTFMEYTDKGIPRQPIFQRIRDEN